MKHTLRIIALLGGLAAGLVLPGCGSKSTVIEPVDLPDFDRAVRVRADWSVRTRTENELQGTRLEPAVTAAAVYIAGQDGAVEARARDSGKRLWRRELDAAIGAGPSAAYGDVVVGTREGSVVALAADTGEERWRAAVSGEVLAPPAIGDDLVVVRVTDGSVVAFARADGALRWRHDGGAAVLALRAASRPLVLADAVLAGFSNGTIAALERESGKLVWEKRIAEPTGKSELDRLVDVAGDFLLEGDALLAATFQGRLVSLDLRSGQLTWQQPLSTFRPLASSGSEVFVVDADSRLLVFRVGDGVALWRSEALLGRRLSGAAVLDDWLLVGDYEGYLHVFRRDTGEIVGRRRIDDEGLAAQPVVAEGRAYVLGRGGKLAALSVEPRADQPVFEGFGQ
jgi:outer membrane protein assembly factor BamB